MRNTRRRSFRNGHSRLSLETLESRQLMHAGTVAESLANLFPREVAEPPTVRPVAALASGSDQSDAATSDNNAANQNVPCDRVDVTCVRAGDEAEFQQRMQTSNSPNETHTFYVFPDAQLSQLDITQRHGDTIEFLPGAEIVGSRQSQGFHALDRGVVNIHRAQDLTLKGLNATNNYQYHVNGGAGDTESAAAVNISESQNVRLENAQLRSTGKTTLWIQAGSTVDVTESTIDCYYFCMGTLASDVTTDQLTINQHNPVVPADRHAAFWVSSSMRSVAGQFFGGTQLEMTDTTINKQSGEGIFAGNGHYDYRSEIDLRGTTTVNATQIAATRPDGWLPVHRNYFGINLRLHDAYPLSTNMSQSAEQFGRFVMHQFQGSSTPPAAAPLSVCTSLNCSSVPDTTPTDQGQGNGNGGQSGGGQTPDDQNPSETDDDPYTPIVTDDGTVIEETAKLSTKGQSVQDVLKNLFPVFGSRRRRSGPRFF